jgi:5-methylcytosine-specific restriction endonuclease McrA
MPRYKPNDVKTCRRCGETKSVSEFPTYMKKGYVCLKPHCRPCGAAKQRDDYAADPAPHRKRARQWAIDHPDKISSKRRAQVDSGANQARLAQRRADGRTDAARAKHYGAEVESVDRQAIIERDGGMCYLCGGKPTGRAQTIDHIIPLPLGPHAAWNLRVACRSCNSRKARTIDPAIKRFAATLPSPSA